MIKKSLFILIIALASVWILPTSQAHAASFNKNRLIDDSLFTDVDSMTVAEIQSFLESRGSLLANWVDNVNMRRPSDNCVVHYATGMTAAEIIYEAATNWGAQVYDGNGCAIQGAYWSDPGYSNYTLDTVSPKVLLVTLQKEQSLLSANGGYSTDPNAYKNPACCSSNEYKLARAMGYGVPDSGGINEKYLGFYNQINWAAWQLRFNFERSAGNTAWDEVSYLTYAGPMIEGSFRRCGTCSLLAFDGYYPIDGSPLYMDNRATAALYYYTPHTYPGYFGNYNFVQFYSDWFGSTSANAYAYSYHSQSANPSMLQGLSNSSKLRFKNTGSETWYDANGVASAPANTLPVYLYTDRSPGRASDFSATWFSPALPSKTFSRVFEADGITLSPNQDRVTPGQVGEYTIMFTAPDAKAAGDYKEFFTLIRPGSSGSKLKGTYVWATPKVLTAQYKAGFVGQGFPTELSELEAKPAFLKLKNNGNINWYSVASAPAGYKPIRLTTIRELNHASPFSRTWGRSNRPVLDDFSKVYEADGVTLSANQSVVQPGQIGVFEFEFAADKKATNGKHREYLQLVREGAKSPLFGPQMYLDFNYDSGTYVATWAGQTPHPTVNAGDTITMNVRYKNDGTATWFDTTGAPAKIAPVRFATFNKINRSSKFVHASWQNPSRPNLDFAQVLESDNTTLAANQHQVLPGQIAEFEVIFKIPANTEPGRYREMFIMTKDGATAWKMDQVTTMWFDIYVE